MYVAVPRRVGVINGEQVESQRGSVDHGQWLLPHRAPACAESLVVASFTLGREGHHGDIHPCPVFELHTSDLRTCSPR